MSVDCKVILNVATLITDLHNLNWTSWLNKNHYWIIDILFMTCVLAVRAASFSDMWPVFTLCAESDVFLCLRVTLFHATVIYGHYAMKTRSLYVTCFTKCCQNRLTWQKKGVLMFPSLVSCGSLVSSDDVCPDVLTIKRSGLKYIKHKSKVQLILLSAEFYRHHKWLFFSRLRGDHDQTIVPVTIPSLCHTQKYNKNIWKITEYHRDISRIVPH